MGRSHGIDWSDPKKLGRLKELKIQGLSNREAGEILQEEWSEKFTITAIENAVYRNDIMKYCIEKDDGIQLYTKELRLDPLQNYMLYCDFHAPYHSELWINRSLVVSEKLGIRVAIIAGDLFDMNFAKHWPVDEHLAEEASTDIDTEAYQVNPVIKALDYYDHNYLFRGNHENRVLRMTEGKIQARHLFNLFGGAIWEKKFTYSVYDKLRIGEKWLLLHPKSYRQNSASVAIRMAEKFHRHVINAHGHFIAMRYDVSGDYMGIDLGGMFDKRKVEYINKSTTTHPTWNNGFGVIKDGHFLHFHDNTNWREWGAI